MRESYSFDPEIGQISSIDSFSLENTESKCSHSLRLVNEPINTETIISRMGDVPLCIFWVRCGTREACCVQSKAEEQMVSQPRLARFINLFGAERIGTKPDLFFSLHSVRRVRRSDSRIEQWREILHSRQRAGRGRAPLGVGTDADGGTSGKKGALG